MNNQESTARNPSDFSRDKSVVVVLGMHRSGTSLLANILAELGVDLGNELLAADYHNQAGYWEQAEINRLQDSLLQRLAGNWSGPAWMNPLPLAWERLAAAECRREMEQLKQVVQDEIARARGVFGFKDPRTSRLLPVWRQIFSELNLEPRYLLAIREPSAVAASLARRDQISRIHAESLWLAYNLDALRDAGGQLLGVVDYHRWFTEPREHVRTLAQALNLSWQDRADELMNRVEPHIRPDLRHEKESATATLPLAGKAYELLKQAAATGKLPDEFPSIEAEAKCLLFNNPSWVATVKNEVANNSVSFFAETKSALPTREEFDEARYLECNPDVAAAVAEGKCTSGWQHFVDHGRAEKRRWFRIAKPEEPAVESSAADYDILIPIYNAPDDLRRCVESLLRHTESRHTIYLLDDASPDPRIAPLLQNFAKQHAHIQVVTAERNGGFVANMNRGFALSRRDVIILNSDTEVTPGWLDRMDRCRRSDRRIGIVCPLSNNATILSVPRMNARNELPAGMTPAQFAKLVAMNSERLYPRIPTAIGFCMLITRETLDAVGEFDPAFGLGYCEENDFCLRAWAGGRQSVCCDDAYVHHYGEASFGQVAGIGERRQRNAEVLERRWPHYSTSVYRYCQANPLRKLQERLRRALAAPGERRPHVLQVIHNYHAPGGTELHTQEIVERISDRFRQTVLFPGPVGAWTDISEAASEADIRVAVLNRANTTPSHLFLGQPGDLRNAVVEENFRQFVAGGDYDIVHFQHLAGWASLRLPRIARELGKRCVLSVHDYFLHCPEYVLINAAGARCNKIRARATDEDCLRCLEAKRVAIGSELPPVNEYLASREHLTREVLEMMNVVIVPSEFVRRRILEAFGAQFAERVRVIPHGVNVLPQERHRKPATPLRVGILGSLNYQKGLKQVVEAARLLQDAPVRLEVFGGVPPAVQNRLASVGIKEHGGYRRAQLPALLREVDLVLIPSLFDETFCLTLSEAQALGIPVLASAVGAIPERVIDNETGFLFSPATGEALAARLREICQAPELVHAVGERVRKLKIKTMDQNAEDYAQVYRQLTGSPAICPTVETMPSLDPMVWQKHLTRKAEQTGFTSIIILTWNQLEHTRRCVESIAAHTPEPHELIFVDNGSTDGTVAWLREYAKANPQVHLVENKNNRGFAGGNNQGLALAKGDSMLLLNNDTIVTPGWLGRLLQAAKNHPQTGAFGPMSNCVSGPQLVPTVPYRQVEALSGFAIPWAVEHAGQIQPVLRLVGFCLLMRRAVVEAIGGLDERYGSGNFEDDDFSLRIRLAGFGLAIARDVFVHHAGSQTFKGARIDYRQAMMRNWEIFRAKWQLSDESSMERGYEMPDRPPAGVELKIDLPSLAATHQEDGPRLWREKQRRLTEVPSAARNGRLDEARELFTRKNFPAAWEAAAIAIAKRPFHPEAFLLLAEIARDAGAGHDAKLLAEHARKLAPGWRPAKEFLRKPLKGGARPDWLQAARLLNRPAAPRLSVCLITKNEEPFLAQCLNSVRGLASQIVVVDTGSTDRTVEIARELGAEIHAFAWGDDFSAARNAALEHATGDWVLILDADEELPADQHARLLADLNKSDAIGCRLPLVNCGQEAEGHHFVPRLFRNAPGVHFRGRIHEQAFASLLPLAKSWGLKTVLGSARLLHHGYTQELTRNRHKVERNLNLLRLAVAENPSDANLLMNFGLELVRSGDPHNGLEKYRAAFDCLSAQPAGSVTPEVRETLLTQFTTQLCKRQRHDAVAQVLQSPLAKAHGGLTASLHFTLGLAHFERKQFREAADQMRQCIAKRRLPAHSPINPDIHTGAPEHCLALSLARVGDGSGAEKAFQAALAVDSTNRDRTERVELAFAGFLADQHRGVEALQFLHGMITRNPGQLAAWELGAKIALSRPEFLEFALDWTGEALKHQPGNPALAEHRAEALLLSQAAGEAGKLWETLYERERKPRALAAVILCDLVAGAPLNCLPETAAEESACSREFIAWYQKLIALKAGRMVLQLNEQTEALSRTLPRAADILKTALNEAALAA